MKKILSLLLLCIIGFTCCTEAKSAKKEKTPKQPKAEKIKDVLSDRQYKEIKTNFFEADGTGNMYNCKVAQQRFCKVKDLDTGMFVLCDREVSRTQMESAKAIYKLGRCVKLN